MELFLSFVSIIAYIIGYPTIAGIVGLVALVIFIWFYSRKKEPYRVFVPWLVIAILFNIFLIHYKPNYLLSIGITSSISTWVTSLLMLLYFKWINR
ncbi:hypothetical protein [uncultured Veillonella sp.]|uniref:hypothetical protein n=1 Tax=uncultured Veillonella sp. TaxID=159268 RepID=UPI0026006816|nr:hypothetical protein [uncultured Veillonella sp.]